MIRWQAGVGLEQFNEFMKGETILGFSEEIPTFTLPNARQIINTENLLTYKLSNNKYISYNVIVHNGYYGEIDLEQKFYIGKED